MKVFLRTIAVISGMVALIFTTQLAHAVDGKPCVDAPLDDEAIKALFAKNLDAYNRSGSIDDLTRDWYWPDLVITGQGYDVYRSRDAWIPRLTKAMNSLPQECHQIIKDPTVQSGSVAVVFSTFQCKAAGQPTAEFKVFYVFEKRNCEWRVIRELFTIPE